MCSFIMVFTRVCVLLFLIFFISEYKLTEAQQCKVCQIRDFNNKSQPCICPGDYFCNVSNHECTKCDQYYNYWNDVIIKDREGDIESLLRKLIKRYEVNLGELKNLLEALNTNINNREGDLKDVNSKSNQVAKRILKVNGDLTKLKEDISRVEEKLNTIGNLQSVEDVVKYLTTVKDMMKTIQGKLNQLNFGIDDVELLDIDKFKNISQHLKNMSNNFPVIEKNSLNLALSLEGDIDLLESVISTLMEGNNTGSRDFNMRINKKTNWIENDLLWLFNLLNHYDNSTIDTNGLLKKASTVRSSALKTDSTLAELLQKHSSFDKYLQELKSETQFYKELRELQKRLDKLNTYIESYKKLVRMFRKKQELYEELEKFKKERDEFDKKENQARKYRGELDELLDEELLLVRKFESLEDVKPIDAVSTDIEKMIEEIRQIENDVATHCSSNLQET